MNDTSPTNSPTTHPSECPACGSEAIESETRVSTTIKDGLPTTYQAPICQGCGKNVRLLDCLNNTNNSSITTTNA